MILLASTCPPTKKLPKILKKSSSTIFTVTEMVIKIDALHLTLTCIDINLGS